MLKNVWSWFLPVVPDKFIMATATTVLIACAILIGVGVGLIITWWITGDLQVETLWASSILAIFVFAIIYLNRSGNVSLAGWLLVVLLCGLVTADVAYFGIGTVSTASFVLPIILAIILNGWLAGIALSLFSSSVIWGVGIASDRRLLHPAIAVESFHLTFNAPVLTGVYFSTAIILSVWKEFLI